MAFKKGNTYGKGRPKKSEVIRQIEMDLRSNLPEAYREMWKLFSTTKDEKIKLKIFEMMDKRLLGNYKQAVNIESDNAVSMTDLVAALSSKDKG